MRLPSDEQSPLSMAGNTLLYAHWMTLGSVRITDRSSSLGGTYANPIRSQELIPVLNTLASGTCPDRDSSKHYCPSDMYVPGDSYRNDPGFYVYYYSQRVYDQYWTTPVRAAVFTTAIYWKSNDAIIALEANMCHPPAAEQRASPGAGISKLPCYHHWRSAS
jgi:hypothetical protein